MNLPLRIVFVGHVDHGKSTLIGRILSDTDSLPEGKFKQIEDQCNKKGKDFEYAYLLDALLEEQEQNITIDTTQLQFAWNNKKYVVIDAPGHKEFLKNMVSGASSADAAVLLIDINEGIKEQSRRHGYILHLLGIKQVIVVINKMDLVNFKKEKYFKLVSDYSEFLDTLNIKALKYVPVSSSKGDNVVNESSGMDWYQGQTFIDILSSFRPRKLESNNKLRFPVQDVYRFDNRRIIAGRIESGSIQVGEQVVILPEGNVAKVKSVETWPKKEINSIEAGECWGITLDEQLFVDRGNFITHLESKCFISNIIQTNIFWMGQNNLQVGNQYKLKLVTQEVECKIKKINKVIDASTLEELDILNGVGKNDVGEIVIQTKVPICCDLFSQIETTGRFVLVDGYNVCGGGVIIGVRNLNLRKTKSLAGTKTLLEIVYDEEKKEIVISQDIDVNKEYSKGLLEFIVNMYKEKLSEVDKVTYKLQK